MSGVEIQRRVFLGINYQYQGDNYSIKAKLCGGYYYLEIDDDAPRENGSSLQQ